MAIGHDTSSQYPNRLGKMLVIRRAAGGLAESIRASLTHPTGAHRAWPKSLPPAKGHSD
jgi:hypothetical protein